MINVLAAIPLTIKSLGWTVTGSIGSLTSMTKSVGFTTMVPQILLLTVQALAVTSSRATTVMINVIVRI